jgi:GntR family transcriptional regulator/MocR family aminotransferase
VLCGPEQVLICSGAQAGLFLCAATLCGAGGEAWIEDPGYDGARRAILAAGGRAVRIPVDASGLDVAA